MARLATVRTIIIQPRRVKTQSEGTITTIRKRSSTVTINSSDSIMDAIFFLFILYEYTRKTILFVHNNSLCGGYAHELVCKLALKICDNIKN